MKIVTDVWLVILPFMPIKQVAGCICRLNRRMHQFGDQTIHRFIQTAFEQPFLNKLPIQQPVNHSDAGPTRESMDQSTNSVIEKSAKPVDERIYGIPLIERAKHLGVGNAAYQMTLPRPFQERLTHLNEYAKAPPPFNDILKCPKGQPLTPDDMRFINQELEIWHCHRKPPSQWVVPDSLVYSRYPNAVMQHMIEPFIVDRKVPLQIVFLVILFRFGSGISYQQMAAIWLNELNASKNVNPLRVTYPMPSSSRCCCTRREFCRCVEMACEGLLCIVRVATACCLICELCDCD